MVMRKSSRISAKKSLDTLNDVNLVDTSTHGLPSDAIVSSTVCTNASTDTPSVTNNNDDSQHEQNKINANGDTDIKCSTNNGDSAMDDLPPLEEVEDLAVIIPRKMPPQITEPVPPFERIESNIYRCGRRREPKDVRRLKCDCRLTEDELARGVIGCGENCLNRMMMIECGHRCPLQDNCSNKRFQRRHYCRIEPFPAGEKGWGIRALQKIAKGSFIMEYVGEVVDPEEFMSRVEKYAKKGMIHHYFMALSSDEIIDATIKGNDTRFTNHSCEPNCEIQKWTISGEFRMGLFATKQILMGDELTIDYKFQRYGKVAQKCYCKKPSCRGTIGSADTSDIYIDGSKRNKNEELGKENSEDSLDDNCKEVKDKFKIPRVIGSKRASESSDGPVSDLSTSQTINKKIPSQLSQTASLLLGMKRFKNDQQSTSQNNDQTTATDTVKLTKDQFRLQFELNEMKRQREEDAQNYLKQIEFMRFEIEQARLQRSNFIDGHSGYLSNNYLSDDPLIAWDCPSSSFLSDDFVTLATGPASYLYDDTYSPENVLTSFPILTNNIHDVVIDVSPKENQLMSDDKAVIQTDYGVELVSSLDKTSSSSSSTSKLFAPSHPPPGIYYQCVIEDSVYYAPYPFDSHNNPLDFYATTARASWPDFNFLYDDIHGPLPRNWSRARDSKSNRVYYFHKKSGIVSWLFPEGSGIRPKSNTHVNESCASSSKIESIIASADSTSTPPPSNAPPHNLVNRSPPGIFAISNGIDKETKKNQQAEPDQSLPKKSKQMFFNVRSKKDRDKFKEEITELVKKTLNPYLKSDCKVGRIVSSDDFKFLARKLTHEVNDREIKSGKIELVINETVKIKARNYIRKYMASKGPVFKRSDGKGDKINQDVLSEENFTHGQTLVMNGDTDNSDINGEEKVETNETNGCSVNGQTHLESSVD